MKRWHQQSPAPSTGVQPSESTTTSVSTTNNNAIAELYEKVTPSRLQKLAQDNVLAYGTAMPFPHIAIDGLFPESLLKIVSEELPESRVPGGSFRNARENLKSAIMREGNMGMHTRILFGFLKSSPFIEFLQTLTGIQNLLPDPHYLGSGIHYTRSGGHLNVHADFNRYQAYGLDRRVNAFIFMNDDWPEEYGGHLELWGRDMASCYQRILPAFGRLVVFSSTDFSYHGHPQPLPAPPGRVRRSMALYYYTNGRPNNECLNDDCSGNDHSTLFQTPYPCKVCEEDICKRYDENTPYWIEAS